jgi:ATP-dependent DNA helicase RecG
VEWKQSLGEWKEIVETCAAFASSQGGAIFIGVGPKGERVGVTIGRGSLEDLANKIKINTDPPQFPEIAVVGKEATAVIRIFVTQSPIKPVWAFGRPFKRVGRTNQVLKREETHRLLEITTGRTWDALACEGFDAKDISHKAVRDFLGRAGMRKSTSLKDVLRNLRFGDMTSLTNAAALLFGKFPQRFFVEAKLKCARFVGDSLTHFLDERTIEGPLLQQLDEAMAFVTRNTRQAIVITGKPERDVVPEYPETAVREAITNALCHRSYTDVGTIQLRIHDDRLEVWNPGVLPADLSVAALYRRHGSYPRNPLLASAVFRSRLIEQWGTGTLRIVEACQPHGIKVEFESAVGRFIVRLKKNPAAAVATPAAAHVGAKLGLSLNQVAGDVAGEVAGDVTGEVRRFLEVLQTRPLTRGEAQDRLRLKGQANFRDRYLMPALKWGLVEMTVPDKPRSSRQRYRLTPRGSAVLRRKQ